MTTVEQRDASGSTQILNPPSPLVLPFDKERPPVSSYMRETESIVIDADLWLGLEELAEKAGVSGSVILLAAFNALLFRYGAQDDIVVCTSFERNARSGEWKPFVLRTRLAEGTSTLDLMEQIAVTLKEATENHDCTPGTLAEHDNSVSPAEGMRPFNTAFFFLDHEDGERGGRPSDVCGGLLAHDLAECALVFSAFKESEGLTVLCEYDVELFAAGTIARFLGHFRNVLSGFRASPASRLCGLPLLGPDELRRILEGWNATRVECPRDECVHSSFEAQAERTPDSVALVFGEESLSYRGLNARANRLARHLRGVGVGPEVVVGLYVERSMEMVVGLLGILKAGGAYLPLDPTYPTERVAFMLEDAEVAVVLTQGRLLSSLPQHRAKVVHLDGDLHAIEGEAPGNFPSGAAPHNLAYLIYTSGSTGRPKGVMVEHRNVVNFFTGMDRCLGRNPGGTWLAVTSLSFDISVLEVFWTLGRGFKVVIAPGDNWREGASGDRGRGKTRPVERTEFGDQDNFSAIPALIRRHGVTHFQCTPSMARMLMLDEGARPAFGALQQLLVGGESFPASLAVELRAVVKGDVINMYGPTETTVWSTTCPLDGAQGRIAIGRPIANTQVYIVDRCFQPVPVGVLGELLIGGAGVARGYLNRPELTAERFIVSPFSPDSRARLYRTGDLGRFLESGDIEFIGRLDNQVKVRGHRIELGEIESLLNTHPDVSQSAVVAREDAPGEKWLVGYIVLRNGRVPSAAEFRDFVRGKLPEYMIPAHFVTLEAFPLTPNNKVDRKALPAPGDAVIASDVLYEAPASAIEKALADLWAETLRVRRVGRNDNFFELGGDSLSAIQITFNIRQVCDVVLPVTALFLAPTVAALAKRLEEAFAGPSAAAASAAVAIADVEPGLTPVEKTLVGIWAEALGVARVGRDDNFFDLGGNSLAAIQLTSRLENAFRVQLPLLTLFNAPTVGQLAAVLGGKKSGRETTAIEVGQSGGQMHPASSGAATPSIGRRAHPEDYPLSSGQQRLWFLQQLDGGYHYNDHFNMRLNGRLNVQALESSICQILTRHEAMRSVFVEVDGQPVQRIAPLREFTLPVIDLHRVPEALRVVEATRLAVEEARKPFNLSEGPLWRFNLLSLADEDHVLLIVAHHIAIDGWARGLFLRELCALYKASMAGQPSPLPELQIQYADYAAWQREWIESNEFTRQLDYWRQRLAGAPPLLEIPSDRPRPSIQSFRGARQDLTLSKTLTANLRGLSRREGVTLFMTLLAGFQSLLHRYTGSDDVLVGSPVANRPRPEMQGLIGYFLNTVVFRGDFSANPTFRQLLKRVRETSLEALASQELPLEKLIDALQLERNQSYSPLFQVLFVLQNVPPPEIDIPGLSLRPFEIDNGTAKFDLSVSLFETDDGLTGWLEYSTDLFDAATMERLAGHFVILLEAAAGNPDEPVSRLELLTPGERGLITLWNETQAEYPASKCLHEVFEEQAGLFPNRIALEFAGRQMTYAELDRCANLLASHLQSLGVGPDSLVCLCLERSLEMAVGLLGVLKAGGAYVPLDPAYPAERLAFILADTRARVLLTETSLLQILASLDLKNEGTALPPLVCLDEFLKTGASDPAPCPVEHAVCPENLAYVIYTSGSTGKPKGVQIDHRSVVNFLASMRRMPGMIADDVLVAVTTLCFDIAGLEVFLPLTSGARVVIASREATVDGGELARLLEESGATIMQATPATWRLLIEAGWKGKRTLKILCGGEAWGQNLAEPLLQRCGSLWNMYGPTETTIWSAACLVGRGSPVLIGHPIGNTQFYVLDKTRQPVPAGVPGELHIGGHGVARGYADRAELTAEKFIGDPFSSEPAARLYKTGDWVRYLADGHIEYLGRMDHQVKVRGFRIELGEVEAVLSTFPGVRENVVVVRQDPSGEKQLVGYVVASGPPGPAAAELRRHLIRKLPDYMVPVAFVLLPVLPQLPNGKIDRKALPAPGVNGGAKPYAAPGTVTQKAIAEIWKGLLRVEQVGLYDNFFELGGHSLLAMQLMSRVRNALRIEVPLQRFFASPTLIELCQTIEHVDPVAVNGRPLAAGEPVRPRPLLGTGAAWNGGMTASAVSPPDASAVVGIEIDRAKVSRVSPVSLAQQRLWFLEQLEPNTPVYNLAYAFRLRGSLNIQTLRLSLQSILDRHEPLRTVFGMVGGDPFQVIMQSSPLDVPVVDLSGLPALGRLTEAERLAGAEACQPFNLARDMMLRAKVLRLGSDEHLLLITMHHIASDFWSVGVFFREFAAAYENYLKGAGQNLSSPAIQYADFAAWQRDHLRGEALERQLVYWKQQLAGAPPLLALPTDRPRPEVQTYAGAVASLQLSDELRNSLQDLSRREGVTLFMTLLAGFKVLLHRYTEQTDIVVGSPIAGRNEVETEGLIGFFVNTLVLRTDLSGDPTFSALLGRVRDVALGAYAYQELPFERLVEELHPERNLSYNPLCQILFSFQNPAIAPIETAGLSLTLEPLSTNTAKLDLALYITETAEGVTILAEYNTDLFDGRTVRRMLEGFRILLEGAVTNPSQRIAELTLLDQGQERGAPRHKATSAQAHQPTGAAPAKVPPRDELEQRLVKIWEKVLGVRPIGVQDNFFDLGGHSLIAVRLFLEIKKVTKRELPLATLFQGPTVEQLARLLRDSGWIPPSRSLVPIHPDGSRPPFFCVHGGGGNVILFRGLSQHLGSDYPFYGLQSQGVDGARAYLTRVEDMAACYLEEIREVQPEGPYYLGGFCMGGSIAYEIAQQLSRDGQQIAFLALFDTYNHNGKPPDLSLGNRLAYASQKICFHWINISRLPVRECGTYFGAKIRLAAKRWRGRLRVHGANLCTFVRFGRRSRTLFLEDVNDQAAFSYRPRGCSQKVTLFKHQKNFSFLTDPQMGWADLPAGGLTVIEMPANPGGMFEEPYVQMLAARLREALSMAQQQ